MSFITSEDLYNRLNTDPVFNRSKCVISHLDSVKQKFMDVPLCSWKPVKKGGDIPWHRVFYIKYDKEVIWDRELKLCKIEELHEKLAKEEINYLPNAFTVMTFNVLSGMFEKDEDRRNGIVDYIKVKLHKDTDIICLQEVDQVLLELLKSCFINLVSTDLSGDNVVCISKYSFREFELVTLGPAKKALAVAFTEDVLLICVHLTSDKGRNAEQKRIFQLQTILTFLRNKVHTNVMIAGDFNISTSSIDLLSQFLECCADQFTYDPAVNILAKKYSETGVSVTYDRLFYKGLLVSCKSEVDTDCFFSDHFPISFDLYVNDSATINLDYNKYALAIVCPHSLWESLNDTNPKWMPHLTLFHPFLEEPVEDLHSEIKFIVKKYLDSVIEIAGYGYFEHELNYTVYAQLSENSESFLFKMRRELCDLLHLEVGNFHPHITICKVRSIEEAKAWCSKAIERTFPLENVSYLVNRNSYYECARNYGKSFETPIDILHSFVGELKIYIGGSRVFGLSELSDVDLVVEGSYSRTIFMEKFSKLFKQIYDFVEVIQNDYCYYIKIQLFDEFQSTSVEYDIHYVMRGNLCSDLDKNSFSVYSGSKFIYDLKLPYFRELLLLVKKKAKLCGVYGQQYGYLSGISWAILVANFLKVKLRITDAENECKLDTDIISLFDEFCNYYDSFDFSVPISLNMQGVSSPYDFMKIYNSVEPCSNTSRSLTISTFERIKLAFSKKFEPNPLFLHLVGTKVTFHCEDRGTLKLFLAWWKGIFLNVLLKVEKLCLNIIPSNECRVLLDERVVEYHFLGKESIAGVQGIWSSLESKLKSIFGNKIYVLVSTMNKPT